MRNHFSINWLIAFNFWFNVAVQSSYFCAIILGDKEKAISIFWVGDFQFKFFA